MLVPVVVGIIALGVGWMLGRSGPDTSPSVAPVVASTIAVGDPVATIDPVPTTAPATTGAPQPASPAATTEPARPPMIETDVDVPAALLGQPIEIVAYGNGRQLFHLDLGAVTLRSQRVTAQPFGRARLLVGPTWALFPSNDADLSSTIVWDDGRAAAVEAGTSDQILGVADGGALWWVVPAPDLRAGVIVQRRTVQGEFDEVIAGVPVAPSGVDPAGGVLLELADGWFGVEPQRAVTDPESGAARVVAPAVASITSGRLLAISAGLALVEECDDRLVCARIVVDRATGERRAIEPDEYTGPVRYALVGGSSVAPGGRSAVVEVLDPDDRASTQRSLGVVDLVTGAVDDIGPTQDVDQVAWTPDGRFLLFIAGGRVVAYDIEAMLVSVVADELVAIDAFGVRATGE
ncbi:MAG: hypothetical protein R8G01_08425 [Ilumatobacteraceae bacterium]|nr:hypothetical protein [Ilumatobacteraceae bacterium]